MSARRDERNSGLWHDHGPPRGVIHRDTTPAPATHIGQRPKETR